MSERVGGERPRSGSTSVTIALAGDTMLGRGVAAELQRIPPEALVSSKLAEVTRSADAFVLNLECCVSDRGSRWPDPNKPFFFRAPASAVRTLVQLGVSCVTLANNHALDFGYEALEDTLAYVRAAGIATVGAGSNLQEARSPAVLDVGGVRVAVFAFTDHPAAYAARPTRAGVAYADLRDGVPRWLVEAIATARADAVIVTPHWGPNMATSPVPRVVAAAAELIDAGATIVAGHSAHVFHGVDGRVIYDLGDFLDDYATDPILRNDLGLVWLVTLEGDRPPLIDSVPIELAYCRTDLARDEDARWIAERLRSACEPFGTTVSVVGSRFRLYPRTTR
jgi:poly-gamma-glutamate synthesis protein (capsule biosynthesis protein)